LKKKVSGKVKFILLLSVICAIAIAILIGVFGTLIPEKAIQSVLTPVRSGFAAITRQIERYYNYIFSYESLKAENEYLEEKINSMEDEVRTLDSLQRENERLRDLLELKEEHQDFKFCSAYVISWGSSNWKSTFTIAKGESSGISTGMVAVTSLGQVVGLVTETGNNWATVTTILDSSMEISASVTSTGYNGVVHGTYATGKEGGLRMNYLPNDSVLRNDDQVVTTGSTVYPKDLILGYIEDAGFDETGVSKYAVLEPAADFDSLEQIFIITEYISN